MACQFDTYFIRPSGGPTTHHIKYLRRLSEVACLHANYIFWWWIPMVIKEIKILSQYNDQYI